MHRTHRTGHLTGRPRTVLHGSSIAALAALAFASASSAQTIASPADRAQLEGSSFSHFPLGRFNARVQQLHADLPGGAVLTGHAYRRDATQIRGRVDAFAADLQVTVSMSPNAPNRASAMFANNVGPNPTVVLPRTIVGFPATDRPLLDPTPTFDLTIPWAVPFVVPQGGGTVCIDVVMYGNSSAAGPDRNLSLYLDSHESYTDGRNEQPGFRIGQGCPAPGGTAPAFATLTLWHRGTSTSIDVSERNGVPEDGSGLTRAFLCLGVQRTNTIWPTRPDCTLLTSTDVWFGMPGTMNAQGDYDGSHTGLPILPAGYRLWMQAGSAHLGTGDLAFGDLSTLITPPAAPATIPAARVANSTDRNAATGSVSLAVTVTRFL